MMKYVITTDEPSSLRRYPVRPGHINAGNHFYGAFGNAETEVSAGWIVRFCQTRGNSWQPFPMFELRSYYFTQTGRSESFLFNRLTTEGYVVAEGDMVYLTHEFVARCFLASPDRFTMDGSFLVRRSA